MGKINEKKLLDKFKGRKSFSREDLFDFYHQIDPELNENTFNWRIHDLLNRNVIYPVKRGAYSLHIKQEFVPTINERLRQLASYVNDYGEAKYCIWETAWINEFARHQVTNNYLILETERDKLESMFYFLKDRHKLTIYLQPDSNMMSLYIADISNAIILKPLITRAPIENVEEEKMIIPIPALEKIFVDIAVDEIYYNWQGAELRYIFENLIKRYSLNLTTLLAYARRRGKGREIENFVINTSNE
jgi:hypothetical protein